MSADAIVKSYIDRILRLKEEQDTLAADIREVYAEAKGNGFDKTAMGEVVAYLRKVEKKGRDAVDERGAIFDLYLSAYEKASGTDHATHAHAPDRQARARQRTSEAMDDAKALSAEAAALGLIDPEAHAETARIADAVARKYGVGVIDAEPGEITEHEQPETATERLDDLGSVQDGLKISTDGQLHGKDREPSMSEFARRGNAPVNESVTAGETAPIPDDDVPAFLKKGMPRKTAADYRPHCQHPENCAASGLQHCYSCSKLIAARESEAA